MRAGVSGRKPLRKAMRIRPVHGGHHHRADVHVGLKFGERGFRDGLGITFLFVPAVKPDLKAHALPEFIKQQAGNMQRLRHGFEMRRRRRGIVLLHVKRAQKRRVREGNHPSSPSNSAARISATSLAEKTRSPQVSFNCAMMSALTSFRRFSGVAGTRRAKSLPALVISTGSPSEIHAATRGKRLRKSLTVAVFIVRLICITAPRMSRGFSHSFKNLFS